VGGYAVALDVHDVPVLVVGGGPVGARKAAGLSAAGARVRLVARRIGAAVDRAGLADWHERPFVVDDLDGVRPCAA
jgi:siroheme synthase (precorrin-2 oxidase/ferrochelatase)